MRAQTHGNLPIIAVQAVDTYNYAISEKTRTLLAGHYDKDGLPCVAIYQKTIGALCARDYKGVGNQYVSEDKLIVEIDPIALSSKQQSLAVTENTANTLGASDYKEPQVMCVPQKTKWIVRRVTPTECARLQGMPDWWCDGVKHFDSAEYKMWGNGMALPCVMYIMQNLSAYYRKNLLGGAYV